MKFLSGRRLRTIFKIFLTIVLTAGISFSATSSETGIEIKRVLFLNSYSASHDSFSAKYQGLKEIFDNTNVIFDMEFLDSKRFKNEENYKNFYTMLLYKIKNSEPYDAIVVSDDDALRFAINYQESLFKETPIVFLGINSLNLAIKAGNNPWITGIVESISIKETILLAHKLNQKAKKVLALVDESITGQANLEMFSAVESEFPGLEFLELNLGQFSLDEYKVQLESISQDTIVVYLAAFQDKNGKNIGYSESIALITQTCSVPVYQISDIGIGSGITGGYVINFVNQGNLAAKMVLEILSGKPVSSIEVMTKSPNIYKFDYVKMQEYNLDKDLLPSNTLLINYDLSLFERYRYGILLTLFLLLLQGFIIVILILNIRKRHYFEKNLFIKNEEIQKATLEIEKQNKELVEAHSVLMESEARYRILFSNSPESYLIISEDVIIDCNRTSEILFGRDRENIVGFRPDELSPEFQFNNEKSVEKAKRLLNQAREGKNIVFEWIHIKMDGTELPVEVNLSPMTLGGHLVVFASLRDISERKLAYEEKEKLKEQLSQSQKMEAVGQLAGGVAHDFNNLLGGIMGLSQLLQNGENLTAKQKEYISWIFNATERAANLTKKLLTFSRKGAKASTAIDCLKVVNDTLDLLQRTIDKNITISLYNNASQTTIIGDDSLLQNALLNMGINSYHAMPKGGKLSFTLENLELDNNYCELSSFDIKPGKYLEITVQDSGLGMSQEVVSRIFEPFFTTKEQGKGTGLGLAMVYGTIQEHRGSINVYSEEGIGTVFHIFLPVTGQTASSSIENQIIPIGSGTILLVDDEELIRITAGGLLESLGFSVLLSENGKDGLELFKRRKNDIDLVILDMIMPEMGGREIFSRMKEIDPKMPILISSGFAKEEDMTLLKGLGVSGFLHKPFRAAELSEKIIEVLKR